MTPPRKLSDVLKEMAELLLRNPRAIPTSEAMHVALFFANVAWNESIGIVHPRASYRQVWGKIEADNPSLWKELKSKDVDGMIDELIRYKQTHFPHDRRRILLCGIPDSKIRVEWLAPAAPGVDAKWEMRLYGLVRTGRQDEAIRFLQQTRKLSRRKASRQVSTIVAELGLAW